MFGKKQQPLNNTVSSKSCPFCGGEEHTANGACAQGHYQTTKEIARSQKQVGVKVTGGKGKGN